MPDEVALDWKLVKLLRGHAAVSLWCYSVSGAERLPVCSLLQPCYSGRMWQRKGGILKRLHLAKTAKVTGAADDVTRHQETRCHLCNNKKKNGPDVTVHTAIYRTTALSSFHIAFSYISRREVPSHEALSALLNVDVFRRLFFSSLPPAHTHTHTHAQMMRLYNAMPGNLSH